MKGLLVINRRSGNCANIEERLSKLIAERHFDNIESVEITDDFSPDLPALSHDKDVVICCGGDGTLNSVINGISPLIKELIYLPCGTFNDMAGQFKSLAMPEKVALGAVNGRLFSYVAATGTFTPIGYNTNLKLKRRLHKLAYFLTTFKEFRLWKMPAEIVADGESFKGVFTLIMFVKSRRVFGFNFNRLFDPNGEEGQLLLFRAPKGFAYLKLFFMFFRTFILGLSKPYRSKNIVFKSIKKAELKMSEAFPFCLDGELYDNGKELSVLTNKRFFKLTIY